MPLQTMSDTLVWGPDVNVKPCGIAHASIGHKPNSDPKCQKPNPSNSKYIQTHSNTNPNTDTNSKKLLMH